MAIVLTAEELGRYLNLSRSTIDQLVRGGKLPGFRVGDSWQFDMDDIRLFLRKTK